MLSFIADHVYLLIKQPPEIDFKAIVFIPLE